MARKQHNEYQPPKKKVDRSSLKQAKQIFKYLRPYKWQYAFGMILLALTGFIALVVPRLMGQMAGVLIDQEIESDPMTFGGVNFDFSDSSDLLKILILVLVVQSLISFFRVYVFAWVSENMMINLRADTFKKIIAMPMNWFNSQRVGDLNSRISADISAIQETFTTTTAELLRQTIIIVFGIAMLFYFSSELAIFMLSIIPIVIIVAAFFGRFIRKLSKATQSAVSNSNVVVEETFTSIINVKAFTNEGFEFLRYLKDIREIKSIGLKAATWRGAFAAFIILFIFGSITFIVWKAASMVQAGDIDASIFLSFVILTMFIGGSIGGIPIQYAAFQRGLGAIENVLDILDLEEEPVYTDKRDTEELKLKGNVRFENVQFSYASRADVEVLKGLSFSVEAGKTIALVGSSGSGKSTIAALILQLYKPNSGKILFDEQDASSFELQALRNEMAFVPQEVLLFGGTIRENIVYGDIDASEQEIMAAAKKANASEFINSFPDGLDTIVGERGIQLSGGQRQRIAIARAVLKNPRILVLDEATSALDSESESQVQQALDLLMEGRTSIVIAHRLSTIRRADQILVLEEGKIIERGKHEELIQNDNGVYKHLSSLQFDK
ncbi:MAG: ABC transporter ATP-binding protein [Flavobacteriales bacterium]|nr:ABC transporter ATP-binding protein [Flavobacteriales bacterium]